MSVRFPGIAPDEADLERIHATSEGLPGVARRACSPRAAAAGTWCYEAGRWSWNVDALDSYEMRTGLSPLLAEALANADENLLRAPQLPEPRRRPPRGERRDRSSGLSTATARFRRRPLTTHAECESDGRLCYMTAPVSAAVERHQHRSKPGHVESRLVESCTSRAHLRTMHHSVSRVRDRQYASASPGRCAVSALAGTKLSRGQNLSQRSASQRHRLLRFWTRY